MGAMDVVVPRCLGARSLLANTAGASSGALAAAGASRLQPEASSCDEGSALRVSAPNLTVTASTVSLTSC